MLKHMVLTNNALLIPESDTAEFICMFSAKEEELEALLAGEFTVE